MIGFEVSGALTEFDIKHIQDKIIGNPVYVRMRDSFVSAIVEDRFYDGRILFVKIKINDSELSKNIDDKEFIACNYHYIDPVIYLTESCH